MPLNNIYKKQGLVFKREDNNDAFDYSDGNDIENYLLKTIEDAGDLTVASPHWNQYIKDWPTKYHLSPQRPDLLRPFEEAFRGRSILEIGCGCGAITRFLGEAGANVTALEGSFRRAKITAARCRDLSNVEVVCDNFQDFVSDKKYDFVVLVGVLEYSSVFVNSESPAHDVLLKSASYMSGDGKIIVAIENKLGMKYWAGAPEDHVGEAFFGIENRYHSKTARTYGRKELASLLSEAGFGEQEFLFSLPDYKLPSIILREAALEPGGPDLKNLIVPATDHPQFKSYYPTFSPERTWQEVIDNGLTAEFANSFLVVASATSVNSLLPADHLGYIYSSNRHPAFRKGNVFVKKHDGVYIERVLINKEYPAPADFLLKQELVTEKYISGKIMFIGFLELITRRGWSVGDIVAWAKPWVDHVKALASDDQMIPGQYLDLTPMNLLVMPDGNTRHFDQEWVAQQTLPLWYVLYRGLYFCFSRPLYFHVPKHGTAVHAFQLINEIIGHFITTKPDLSEGFKKLEHKYLSPVSLTPDYVPVDFRINLWEHNKEAVDARAALHSTKVQLEVAETQLAESRKLNDEVRKINSHQTQEIARLQAEEQRAIALDAENNRLKRDLEWFSNTYEKRGMFGVMKTKFRNFVKRVYLFILNFLVKLGFVQKRYVMKYMLEYTRDNGLGTAMRNVKSSVKEHGIGAVTHARKYALEAMSREASAKAPVPVAIVEEDLYPESQMIEDIEAFAVKPLFSIIMPTYNTKPSLLKMAIESVQKQVYTNWELCIVDDGSKSEETKDYLKNYPSDPRIRLAFQGANGGISAASNEAIKISTGDYLALFDHDDELAPDALYWMVKEINQHPEAEIIYTDECKKNEAGDKSDYFLKPDWSPQLMLNMMYVGHFTVYHKKFLLEKVGMFRSEYDFSQDYDLMLRATEQTTAIRHIPKVLYYWRQTEGSAAVGDKPYARQTNIKALEDAVRRRNIDGEVIELPTANRVKLKLSLKPFVSIIIPTDSYDNLTATIESIAASTSYINYEIVPVTNSKLIGQLDNKYPDLPMNFVRYDKPYNFSDKCNEGAKGCKGEIVLFLNDDVRPLQVDWIENTIEYLELPGIGGVSPKLIYEDDSIQYAGMITGVRNLTGTSFHCYHRDSTAYINFPQLTREVSILSGACLAMRRDLFLEVDGFDAVNAPSAHSDVDLSFKILEKGLRCIYTPYAGLRHIGHLSLKIHEEKESKKKKKDKSDIFLLNRWPGYVAHDPYFPVSMRNLLYHDSPTPMTIYPGRQREYIAGNKDVLILCHDLTRSGAPIMLYNICKVLTENGYFVVLACAKDGPIRSMYSELGINVIIDPLIVTGHSSFEKFAINFDYIIGNTVVNYPAIRQMQDKVKTIWWLQEAKVIDHFINEPDFVPTLINAKNIVGVSDYSLNMVRKYNNKFTKIYNACYDFYEPSKHDKDLSAKIRFTIVGSIESRKGHDILFEALDYLEQDVIDRLQIRVVGRVLDPAFRDMVTEKIRGKDFISFAGEIDNAGAVKEVAGSDVIVCPSRDDPFPVVLVEAFCMAKTCIVSDATGFAELIEDDETGFVFPSEDAKALAAAIRNIVLDPSKIERIGNNARSVYLRELSIPVLQRRLIAYMDEIPEPGETLSTSKDKTGSRKGTLVAEETA